LVTGVQNVSRAQRPLVHAAMVSASVSAFRVAMMISAALALLGGLASFVGIVNPRRRVSAEDCRGGPVGINPEAARAGPVAPAPAPASTGLSH
jgi:hypothetical protein